MKLFLIIATCTFVLGCASDFGRYISSPAPTAFTSTPKGKGYYVLPRNQATKLVKKQSKLYKTTWVDSHFENKTYYFADGTTWNFKSREVYVFLDCGKYYRVYFYILSEKSEKQISCE